MRKICFVLVVIMTIALAAVVQAQQVTVDLSKLPPEEAAKVLAAQQMAEGKTPVGTPPRLVKHAEEWAQFGERFGQVIASICRELNIAVNDFITTPVGKLAAVMIFWKVMGDQLWGIVGGSFAWIFITSILLWSFRQLHMSHKIKDKTTGEITYVPRHDWGNSKDSNEPFSVGVHVGIFVIFTIVCLVIIF